MRLDRSLSTSSITRYKAFSMETQATSRLKIVLIGNLGAGKTSIMWRFIRNEFNPQRLATIICSPPSRNLIISGVQTSVELWDTAGQERFGGITALYYRNTDCAIAVYDVGARRSFEDLEFWRLELESKAMNRSLSENCETPPLLVLGNKADTEEVVSWSEAQTWARARAVPLCLCSALTGEGVETAFQEAARLGLNRQLRLRSSVAR